MNRWLLIVILPILPVSAAGQSGRHSSSLGRRPVARPAGARTRLPVSILPATSARPAPAVRSAGTSSGSRTPATPAQSRAQGFSANAAAIRARPFTFASRSASAFRNFRPLSRGQRRAGSDPPADPQPTDPAPEYIPPYDYTPGALIRTAGLGYTTTPTNDAHWQNQDLGYAIAQEEGRSWLLNPHVGAHYGPPDKLPPPNPGSMGAASGRTAITPNSAGSP